MSKVRLNYDGWLALPEAVRRQLGVGTGDQLDVELVQGAVILRPTSRTGTVVPPPAEPAETEAEPAVAIAPAVVEPAKQGPGRPRKITSAAALPARLKSRGRRAAAPTVE